jgi:hypothetical protein
MHAAALANSMATSRSDAERITFTPVGAVLLDRGRDLSQAVDDLPLDLADHAAADV